MVTFFKNNGFALLVALLCIAAPELALAAGGADTGASTGNNIKSWLVLCSVSQSQWLALAPHHIWYP